MKEGIGWEKFCEFVLIPVLSIFLELTAATPFDNPLDSQRLQKPRLVQLRRRQ